MALAGDGPLERNARSPASEAVTVMFSADDWYHNHESKNLGDFVNILFAPVYKNEDSPDSLMHSLYLDEDCLDPVLNLLTRVAIYCSAAIKSDKSGDLNLAWTYATDAVSLMGEIKGGHGAYKAEIDAVSNQARKGASAAHAENRAMKRDAFKWLDENRSKYKSMDATAQAMTGEQPIAFRTARSWVGDWKKLRSAGTL